MNDSAETVVPAYGERFDQVRFKGLRPGWQGCSRSKRPVGSAQVEVPLVLAQRVPAVCYVNDCVN
jgi:hypothetical protein